VNLRVVLIISIKPADWATRHVAQQVDRLECAFRTFWEQWNKLYPRAENSLWSNQKDDVARRGSKNRFTSALGSKNDSFHDKSDVELSVILKPIPRHLTEANYPFRVLLLTL